MKGSTGTTRTADVMFKVDTQLYNEKKTNISEQKHEARGETDAVGFDSVEPAPRVTARPEGAPAVPLPVAAVTVAVT
jgi:hypothetical protein